MQRRFAVRSQAIEWSYLSGRRVDDPFNQLELDVVFAGPDGQAMKVPAFWADGQEWRVRFAPSAEGTYTYRTVCSDPSNPDLHGQEGELEVSGYQGDNPLLRHGPLGISPDGRHLRHQDGTPFLWLGDTWWTCLSKRLRWPDEFQWLTADRVAKGFSVVQIVAGPHPDMPAFDPRNDNEAGYPWEPGWARVNPAYYDMADLRIQWLVRAGLVPCILGCWGYYLPWLGVEKMKRHWRYLVARYGAYPVVWCLAGEGAMPWYLSKSKEDDTARQRDGWAELARYVRQVDPCRHPITIHPRRSGRDDVADDTLLDFEMLQTGHNGYESLAQTVDAVRAGVARAPRMPVVNGEVCYEGIFERSWADVQRLMFWSCMLSGACGFTYGANGIWQVNTPQELFGASPSGHVWGNRPWLEAAQLPGAAQLGGGKRILERFAWWRFESFADRLEPGAGPEKGYLQAYAAGIPGEVCLVYLPRHGNRPVIKGLGAGAKYRAVFIDPKDATEYPIADAVADAGGAWRVPAPPITQDWLLALTK